MPVPTPQEQIEFLQKVQRLLSEGLFVASCKFALLRALADLAVLKGDDSGDELELSIAEIAEVFVELYWRQARPFCGAGDPQGRVLRQNTGGQATVVQKLVAVQNEFRGSLPLIKTDRGGWTRLVGDVSKVICEMPLWKLQRVGDEVVDFLYLNAEQGGTIKLRPGVAFCLRRFYGILRNLVEGAWINYVRNQNLEVLGHSTDLGAFLFGAERSSLEVYRPILLDLQADSCFYCRRSLGRTGDVDHFIPWSRYPVDLGHNFVLTHRTCNGRKRDYLAAEPHLAAWTQRNAEHGQVLSNHCQQGKLPSSMASSVSIAHWAYSQTANVNGLVWVEGDMLTHLIGQWADFLRVA